MDLKTLERDLADNAARMGQEEGFGGVELEAEEEVFGFEAGGGEGVLDDAAGSGADLAKEEGLGGEVGEGDTLAGPLMAGGDDEDEVVLKEGLDVDAGVLLGAFEEGELDVAGGEGGEHAAGVAAAGGDAELGIGLEEGGDDGGEEVVGDGLGGAEGEISGVLSGGAGDGGEGALAEVAELLGEGEEGEAGGGEGDAAAGAVEEGEGELLFEGLDLLGDGGLGEQEILGGAAEAEVAGDGAEDDEAKVFKGHGVRGLPEDVYHGWV